MATNKKGISSTELSRKLNLRQKTCWTFPKKVSRAMKSSKDHPMNGVGEVDEMVADQRQEGIRWREKSNKKLLA